MGTACVLKEKVTKILTIIEQLDNENITPIDKDLLLQEVRNLYSEILLINTDLQSVGAETNDHKFDEPESMPERAVEDAPVEEQVISVSFDDKEFDYSDLLGIGAKVADDVKETIVEPESKTEEIQQPEEPVVEIVSTEEESVELEPAVEPVAEEIQHEEIVEEKTEVPVGEEIQQTEEVVENFVEPIVEEEHKVEEVVEEPKVDEVVEKEPKEEEVVEEEPVEEPFVEETRTEPKETAVEESTETEPSNPQPEPTRLTLGEQLGQSRQTSLNDRFASQNASDLSSRIGLKPISDIKSAISLGDRFIYIRELFDGNGTLFESTISNLNSMQTYEDAEKYITSQFNWDMETQSVTNFMNVVRRKFL